MIRLVAIVSCALLLGACGTSYKVAPSAAKITTKIETAKRSTKAAQKQTAVIESDTARTQVEAKTTAEHIDAAVAAVQRQDYVTAAQELIAAKASNALVMHMLEQSYRNIQSLKDSHASIESDLGAALEAGAELQKTIEKMAIQGAKDRAIVEEVNWGFLGVHIGALFYFVKSVLRLGFIGVVILIVLVVVLLILGATVGGPFLKAIGWLWGLLRKRKSG